MNRTITSSSRAPAVIAWASTLLGMLLALAPAPSARAQSSIRHAVGSKDALWVLTEADGPEGRETRVWGRQLDRKFRRPRQGDRYPSEVAVVAACGADLHLFLSSGAHYRLGLERVSPQPIVPGREVPICLTGDSSEEVLYAIARITESPASLPTTTRSAPSTAPSTRGPTSQPHVARSEAAPEGVVGKWALYRLHRSRWSIASVMPDWFDDGGEYWMCAEQGEVHLFGLPRSSKETVWSRRFSAEQWSASERLPLPPRSVPVAAMVLNTYRVLVARIPTDRGRTKLVALRWVEGQWRQAELQTERGGPIELSLDRFRAAGFNERIALVGEFARDKPLQVGLWALAGGPPEEPLEPLPEWKTEPLLPQSPQLPQFVVVLILGAVIILTVWRRQRSLVREIPLPAQLQLASIWRRLAAFLIDLGPALAVTAVYWLPEAREALRELDAANLTDAERAEQLAVLWWLWLAVRVLYALYCGLIEYRWGTTPGKRVMRCWVVTDELSRPRPKQVAIRNVLKVLELQPEVVALLVFIALTRNRQRLGDILAATIVVEPAAMTPE